MKLIIDIPETPLYKDICENGYIYDEDNEYIAKVIANGTPLPKEHGRLIDADAYIKKHEEFGWLDDITVVDFNANTPTIIEADKG